MSNNHVLGILLFFLVVNISGCFKTNQESMPVRDGGDSGQDNGDKPINDIAPLYQISQFQVGQWIEWKKTSSTGIVHCVRWSITAINADGVFIQGKESSDCKTYGQQTEFIRFDPDTGEVHEDQIVTPGVPTPTDGGLRTIFHHLYGNKEVVSFHKGILKLANGKYPGFQLVEKGAPIFYDHPREAFHAVAIKWTEGKSPIWTYTLNQSNPAIASLPQNQSMPVFGR
jgi:hypothetical protein